MSQTTGKPLPAANGVSHREEGDRGFFTRLKQGLNRTRARLGKGLRGLTRADSTIDADLLEEVETLLLSADVGVMATDQIVSRLQRRFGRHETAQPDAFMSALREELEAILLPCNEPLRVDGPERPFVILMVGVNGAGKTTTIGKLAKRFQSQGLKVMLAAGDTFRAAAVQQIEAWGERNRVPVIAQGQGADSASVIFDAWQAARARGIDVLIADTAGRLHTQDKLMEELQKIMRVLKKQDQRLPDEVLLVLDATTGQNALSQARRFPATGIALTKLDGSARGGVLFGIARQLELPIRFIGVGEQADDLRPFDARQFVAALLAE